MSSVGYVLEDAKNNEASHKDEKDERIEEEFEVG